MAPDGQETPVRAKIAPRRDRRREATEILIALSNIGLRYLPPSLTFRLLFLGSCV